MSLMIIYFPQKSKNPMWYWLKFG